MYLELLSNLIYLIFFFRMLIMCVYLTIIGLAKENLASPTVCGKTGENCTISSIHVLTALWGQVESMNFGVRVERA